MGHEEGAQGEYDDNQKKSLQVDCEGVSEGAHGEHGSLTVQQPFTALLITMPLLPSPEPTPQHLVHMLRVGMTQTRGGPEAQD